MRNLKYLCTRGSYDIYYEPSGLYYVMRHNRVCASYPRLSKCCHWIDEQYECDDNYR